MQRKNYNITVNKELVTMDRILYLIEEDIEELEKEISILKNRLYENI